MLKVLMNKAVDLLKNHEKKILLGLVLITLILRLGYVFIVYSHDGTSLWYDDWQYLHYGQQIADGNWNPTQSPAKPFMQVGPGLPMLIALSIVIFADPVWPVILFNVVITSLIVWVLFYLGKLVFDRKVGWLLAAWGVCYDEFYHYNPHLLKEPITLLFFLLTVYFLIKSIKNNGQIRPLILSALSYIWLIHADERYLFYAPVFVLAFVLIKPFDLKTIVSRAALWGMITLVLLIPWTIHNIQIFDQVVLISPRTTAFTAALWGKNIQDMRFGEDASRLSQEKDYLKAVAEGKPYGLSPRRYGKYEKYARAFINFWQPAYFQPTFIRYGLRLEKWPLSHNVMGLVFYGIFLPFYVFGLFLLIKRKYLTGLFLAGIPIFHSLLHTAMVWPLKRYRAPVVFCVVCVAIWVLMELAGRFFAKTAVRHAESSV
jgi:hypothetical protein